MTLEKVCGSLGFTLRQEDTSILGHYVRVSYCLLSVLSLLHNLLNIPSPIF